MTRYDVDVTCDGDAGRGWQCDITVSDSGRVRSTHRVAVTPHDLRRLAPGQAEPTPLVEASFDFLLQREPPESILRTFDLVEIGSYFPEYEGEFRRR